MLNLGHSTPQYVRGPCWYCMWWDGLANAGMGALCRRPNGCRVQAEAETVCVFWVRDVGVDDEPWQPVGWTPIPRRQEPWVTGQAAIVDPTEPRAPPAHVRPP